MVDGYPWRHKEPRCSNCHKNRPDSGGRGLCRECKDEAKDKKKDK